MQVLAARSPYRFHGLRLLRRCEALEAACRVRMRRRHALALSSGTAALHTALAALEVGPGDEVILPAYAWSADLMAVLAVGAVPVIAPIDETLGLDPRRLPECATRRTRAVVAVHMRGVPCDLRAIAAFARQHRIAVIEDGAQCLGGRVEGRPVGSGGDVSVLSFQYNKLVTAGEGGMLLTDDRRVYERARRFHDLGMRRNAGEADPAGLRCIESFGLNYRMSELQAAVLLEQVKKMPMILAGLRAAARRASASLGPAARSLGLAPRPAVKGTEPNQAFLCLQADEGRAAARAAHALRRQGLPVQRASRLDGHHPAAWQAYLRRARVPFRAVGVTPSTAILNRTLFLEINGTA